MDHMQQSETEIELFSSSAVSPIDERHISMLFDASTNGTYHDTIRGSRKNGDTLRTNRSPCAKPASTKKRRKLQDSAPKWERRTIKISIHFFYVIAIGVLFCLVIYLIILNRSIYSAVYQSDDRLMRPSAQQNVVPPLTDPPTPAALDLRLRENATRLSNSSNSTSLTSRSTTGQSTTLVTTPQPSIVSPTPPTYIDKSAQTSSTRTPPIRPSSTKTSTSTLPPSSTQPSIADATTSFSNETCPVVANGATTIVVQPTGLQLYVGPIANHSEAVRFCSRLAQTSKRVQIVQFSESSKFENTRDDLERLIEEQNVAIWVNAVVVDYNWYWNNWNEQISVSEEMDADEAVETADCAVLQKRYTDLRLEKADCYNAGLVVCECSISF